MLVFIWLPSFALVIHSGTTAHWMKLPTFVEGLLRRKLSGSALTDASICFLGNLNPVKLTMKIKHYKPTPCELATQHIILES